MSVNFAYHLPFLFDMEFKRDARGRLYGDAKCPVCAEQIILRKKKDRESFSREEYAKHYEQKHLTANKG